MKNLLLPAFLFCTLCTYAQSTFLDSSFGTNGILVTPDGTGGNNTLYSVIVQPDNKIITAGIAQGGTIVMRYNENGTPDNTFATGGTYATPFIGGIYALLLQPDGKVITAGYAYIRLNVNGTLDSTFGHGGLDTVPNLSSNSFGADAITLQSDGKIVLAGSASSTYIALARLQLNGKADSTFGVNGLVVTNIPGKAKGVSVMPDGRIVIGGFDEPDYFLIAMRFMPNGQIDTSFNHAGIAAKLAGDSYNIGTTMLLQPDGKIVVGGSATFGPENGNFALVRYNTNGSVDNSFCDNGVANIDFNLDDDEVRSLTVQLDGKIIAAGYATIGSYQDFAITRLDSNGHIDSSFGANGRITTDILHYNDLAYTAAIQPDGKIVLAGSAYSETTGGTGQMAVARYENITTGIKPILTSQNPVLYPNPVSGKLTISNTNHIIDIRACDILGNNTPINVNLPYKIIRTQDIADGLYFFTISLNDRPPITQKILIRH